ncbi:MAG: TIM barrel protein [Acidobacteriota bacterium]
MKHAINRRVAMGTLGAGLAGAWSVGRTGSKPFLAQARSIKGNIRQSICKWCYKDIPLEELCQSAARMGYQSIELLTPEQWPIVKKYGLTCAMGSGAGTIEVGFNRKENHEKWQHNLRQHIHQAADLGVPNVICFSGNRAGMDDEEGLENCVIGIMPLLSLAEKKGVTIAMELLNSKVNHKDYMCDRTEWGVKLAKRLGSPRFKLLYDIYHMQIMEGDVIRTIRDNFEYLCHFHTGGNPGRNEIDETQELNYTAICKAIAEKGFTGYLAQEFIPLRDPMTSLEQAFGICDV